MQLPCGIDVVWDLRRCHSQLQLVEQCATRQRWLRMFPAGQRRPKTTSWLGSRFFGQISQRTTYNSFKASNLSKDSQQLGHLALYRFAGL